MENLQFDRARAEMDLDYLLDCKFGDLGDRVQEESKSFNTMRLVQWWMRNHSTPRDVCFAEQDLLRAWANNLDYEKDASVYLREYLEKDSGFYFQVKYSEYQPEGNTIIIRLVWKNNGIVVFESDETFVCYRKEHWYEGASYYYYKYEPIEIIELWELFED